MSRTEPTLMQAIRGPVLMITVGVLLVLDRSTGFGFSRTWPVLVIAFGVMKLFEWIGGGSGSRATPNGSVS